jgi:hypothetical protein
MEKTSTLISNVFNNGKEYLHLKSRAVQLEVYDKVSGLVASAVNGTIIAVFSLFAILFLNIGLGFALSEAFNSHVWGFLSLGAIYLVLLGVFMGVRKPVDLKIKNTIVTNLSDERYTSYETLRSDRKQLKAELERSETLVKGNAEELKENLEIVAEDFKRLKEDIQRFRHIFSFGDQSESTSKQNGAPQESKSGDFKKLALTTVAEMLINRVVMKDVHSIKQLIWPTIAKVLVNTGLSKEKNTEEHKGEAGGFLKSLRDRLARFL